jgi:hypothetical protein
MVVYSRIYQLLLHISIVSTCAAFLFSSPSPLFSQETPYTFHRVLSQSYGTPQGTDFNRCISTRPPEVLKGCPVSWLHTVIRRRSSVLPDVSRSIIVLYRILVLYYNAICDTKPLSYPQARAWNCARCMKLHARKVLNGTKWCTDVRTSTHVFRMRDESVRGMVTPSKLPY